MEFLERLRKQPQHVRSRYALGGAFFVTALVTLIWITTLPARLSTIGGTIENEGATQAGSLQGGLDSILRDVGEDLETVMEVPQEDGEVETHTIDTTSSSLNQLEGWETENTGSQREPLPSVTEQEGLEGEGGSPSSEPQVILIGTTPKKAE